MPFSAGLVRDSITVSAFASACPTRSRKWHEVFEPLPVAPTFTSIQSHLLAQRDEPWLATQGVPRRIP